MQVVYNKQMDKLEIRKNIADNIRQLRAKQRISQELLAEKAQLSQQYIYKIENEYVNPSVEVLIKIADALGVTLNDLVY